MTEKSSKSFNVRESLAFLHNICLINDSNNADYFQWINKWSDACVRGRVWLQTCMLFQQVSAGCYFTSSAALTELCCNVSSYTTRDTPATSLHCSEHRHNGQQGKTHQELQDSTVVSDMSVCVWGGLTKRGEFVS